MRGLQTESFSQLADKQKVRRALTSPTRPQATRLPTQRELDTFNFIRRRIETQGSAPTVREIMDEFGWHSTNGVYLLLKVLQKKGLITLQPRTNRGIALAPTYLVSQS